MNTVRQRDSCKVVRASYLECYESTKKVSGHKVSKIDNIGQNVSSQNSLNKDNEHYHFSYYIINSVGGSKADSKYFCFGTSCIFKHLFEWKLSVPCCQFWKLYGRKLFGRKLFGRIPPTCNGKRITINA